MAFNLIDFLFYKKKRKEIKTTSATAHIFSSCYILTSKISVCTRSVRVANALLFKAIQFQTGNNTLLKVGQLPVSMEKDINAMWQIPRSEGRVSFFS